MYQAPKRSNYRSTYGQRSSIVSQSAVRKSKRTAAAILVTSLVVGAGLFAFFTFHHSDTPASNAAQNTHNKAANNTTGPTAAGFNKSAFSTTDPASIWVVVNKQHQLNPKDYTPANLVIPTIPLRSNITSTEKYIRADAAKALENMVKDAANQGVHFNLQSGYRSYSFQVNLYNGYVKQQGQVSADRQSARPGYSEHQTGLAADLGGVTQPGCNVDPCFANTVEGKWLAANAYRYGFIVRYNTADETTTGYEYEPWHIRYVGTDLASEMHRQGITTLETFFGISGGTVY